MGTRRDFVRAGGWAVAGAWMPVRAQERTANAPRAVLAPQTVRTLMACAEAVTGVRPLRGHYEAYWQHRARTQPGMRELYLRFADAITANAAAAGITDFASAEPGARLAIIDGLRTSPDTREFEIPVFQEILAVFERTDAWLQLGYAAWPGSARGLEEYRKPPSIAPR